MLQPPPVPVTQPKVQNFAHREGMRLAGWSGLSDRTNWSSPLLIVCGSLRRRAQEVAEGEVGWVDGQLVTSSFSSITESSLFRTRLSSQSNDLPGSVAGVSGQWFSRVNWANAAAQLTLSSGGVTGIFRKPEPYRPKYADLLENPSSLSAGTCLQGVSRTRGRRTGVKLLGVACMEHLCPKLVRFHFMRSWRLLVCRFRKRPEYSSVCTVLEYQTSFAPVQSHLRSNITSHLLLYIETQSP